MESCVGANDYRIKMGSNTKTYHMNMLKKYNAREPEVDVVHTVHTSNKDDVTIAVAGVIYHDLESYHQKEGVRDVKLGEHLSKDQRRMLKDCTRSYPNVYTDMPVETNIAPEVTLMYIQICL